CRLTRCRLLSAKRLYRRTEQRCVVDALGRQTGSDKRPVRADGDQPKIFSRDWIFVNPPQKSETVCLDERVNRRRIHSKLPVKFLNSASVFLAPKNQFLFSLSLRLHFVG